MLASEMLTLFYGPIVGVFFRQNKKVNKVRLFLGNIVHPWKIKKAAQVSAQGARQYFDMKAYTLSHHLSRFLCLYEFFSIFYIRSKLDNLWIMNKVAPLDGTYIKLKIVTN